MYFLLFVLQCEGTLLATGSYDGYARIWSTEGNYIIHQYINKGYLKALKTTRMFTFCGGSCWYETSNHGRKKLLNS